MKACRAGLRFLPGFLVVLCCLASCGGGGGGDDAGTVNPLWVSIDTQDLPADTAASQVDLYGSTYCEACPPSEGAFGYCPTIRAPQISGVTITWTNLTTGVKSPTGYAVITGSCACLFSSCMSVYGNHWAAYSVPLQIGENVIEIRAGDGVNAAAATVSITRIPAASQGLTATPGAGEVTLQWESVAAASSYNLYWSTSPDLTRATANVIPVAVSSYLHTGLSENVTYYYALSTVSGAYEGPLSSVVSATPGWQSVTLAATASTSDQWETSIAVDAAGRVHSHYAYNECGQYTTVGSITYCTARLYYNTYLTDVSGAWLPQALSVSPYADANIAVDGGGTVHAGYVTFSGLTHAVRSGGAWTAETIDPLGRCDSALAIDAAGRMHLAYFANSPPDDSLRYAVNVSGVWLIETIDPAASCSVGDGLSLAVAADGTPHIAYAGSSPDYGVKHAYKSAGTWHVEAVGSDTVTGLSSAIDLAGGANIAYTDNFGRLKYAHPGAAGSWLIETIEERDSFAPAIAFGADGRAHISCVASSRLKYAVNAGGTWGRVILDDQAHSDTALAVDSLGRVHIGYFSGRDLKYATNR